MNPEVLNFYLNRDGAYERFIKELRDKLADHPEQDKYIARHGPWLRDHPLLPIQRAIQPARWIHINLIVHDEDDGVRTTIAIRDDNVYFMGFKNRNGDWYEFGIDGKSRRFIPCSTFLGCDMGYGALVGSEDLVNLDLGKEAMTRAVFRLWAYRHVGPADAATRRDLARLCFMICEAARMVPHCRTLVGDGWSEGTRFQQLHVDYAKTWSKMSRTLISCALSDPKKLSTLVEFNVVYLLLNSRFTGEDGPWQRPIEQSRTPGGGGSSKQGTGTSYPQMPSSSGSAPASSTGGGGGTQEHQGHMAGKSVRTRPLVEVFCMTIFQGVAVDTIVVYDGKRGQIIYKHGQGIIPARYSGNAYEVPLIGPYRAISADWSFAIQVDGNISGTNASDESSKVVTGAYWFVSHAYDRVETRVVNSIDESKHQLVEMRYAVLSEAVEATVEVNLLLPGITSVHGTINALYASLDNEELSLFSRERDDKVELVHSSADSMVALELGRAVIAVPARRRYSSIWIMVSLRAATPDNNEAGEVFLQGTVYFYLDKQTGEIRSSQEGDVLVPVGSDVVGRHGASSSSSVQQRKVKVNMTSPGFHVSPLEPESLEHMRMDSWTRSEELLDEELSDEVMSEDMSN